MARVWILAICVAVAGCGQSDLEKRVGQLEKQQAEMQQTLKTHSGHLLTHESIFDRMHKEHMDKVQGEIRATEAEIRRIKGE